MRVRAHLAITVVMATAPAGLHAQELPAGTAATADRIIASALADSTGFERLTELVDRFGHRLSGSESLEQAIDWILDGMTRDGLHAVRGEPVRVEPWSRGEESLRLLIPLPRDMPMLGLGNSVATSADGITGDVLVVGSFEELERRAAEAVGRIVVFDVPFTTYGETVRYRAFGASAAARAGAVAALVRSITPFSLQTPHTGMMIYEDDVPRIPTAAITVEDAQLLRRMQERGDSPRVTLRMAARALPPAQSRNVVAELRGRQHADEVVLVGGHIDSWDVGQGAMDNAGGAVAAWEALRLLHRLGLQPRRTIRVVLWTDEEQGGRGARAYRDRYRDELDRHSVVIEADGGVFAPSGFGFSGSDAARTTVNGFGSLLASIDAIEIGPRGGGADAAPLMQLGVPAMSLEVAGERYFWYHHSEADTIDKLDADEFNRCVAALAVMAYMIAELPELLPRR